MQIYLNNRRPTRSISPLCVVRDLLPKFYFLAIESSSLNRGFGKIRKGAL